MTAATHLDVAVRLERKAGALEDSQPEMADLLIRDAMEQRRIAGQPYADRVACQDVEIDRGRREGAA